MEEVTLSELFTQIADELRVKLETDGKITASDFPNKIAEISKGIDTSDATATAKDIRKGKTAYVNGEKIVGTLVVPYTQLEYIESDGNQYVNVGYYPNGYSQFELTYSNLVGVGQLFGAHNSGSDNGVGLYTNTTGDYHFWCQYKGNYDTGIDAYNVTSADVIINRGSFTINDSNYTLADKTFIVNYPLYIFAGNIQGVLYDPVPMRLHKFIVKEKDIILHNYIPVIYNETGEIGLYDLVDSKFFRNIGTGTFKAGPEIE